MIHFLIFVILFILRWGALLVGLFLLLAAFGDGFDFGYLVGFFVCLAVFLWVPKLNSYSPVNFNDAEYSENGKKPYATHITKLGGDLYSIEAKDSMGNTALLEAKKKKDTFIVDDDSISEDYQDWVTTVKFKVTNLGRNIQEYDYTKYSKKPDKQKIQKLITNHN